jgi:hypothetical protein
MCVTFVNVLLRQTLRWPRVSWKHNVKKNILGKRGLSMSAQLHWLRNTSRCRLRTRKAMALLPWFFSLSPHPDWLRGLSNLPPNGYLMFYCWRQNSQVVISHVHLVCQVKKSGSLTSNFPHMFNTWCLNTATYSSKCIFRPTMNTMVPFIIICY